MLTHFTHLGNSSFPPIYKLAKALIPRPFVAPTIQNVTTLLMEAKPKGGTGGDSASKRSSSPQRALKRGEGGRRGSRDHHPAPATAVPPCGACKFLRRKCVMGCVFAPYFGTEQGAARFASVHKVFGASNVSKLLQHVPMGRRQDAVVTICYEAQARISDPVYGCVSTILALQHQVASLQTELSIVQSQLINSRWVVSNAIQGSQQQQQQQQEQQQQQHIEVLQPAYSNISVASNNIASLCSINSGLELAVVGQPRGFEALHIVQPSQEEEEESQNLVAFNDGVFNSN